MRERERERDSLTSSETYLQSSLGGPVPSIARSACAFVGLAPKSNDAKCHVWTVCKSFSAFMLQMSGAG